MHPTNGFDLFSEDEPRVGIVAGTGPSLTPYIAACNQARASRKARLFGCNNAIFHLELDAHLACNYQWWDYYADQVRDYPCHKWTTRPESARNYPWVRYIQERWIPGLSTDTSFIAAHHGSGPQILNMALHYGCKTMLLVGWDMAHRPGLKRHFFGDGEYPEPMRHFTKGLGPNGELLGLIREMETIKPEEYGVSIINCTPGSAMTCFPMGNLEDYL